MLSERPDAGAELEKNELLILAVLLLSFIV
jgi:hypothetical protein